MRPEYADEWPALVQDFTAATRAEPGNIYRSAEDPDVWRLVEAFVDGSAGKAHVESAHFNAAIAAWPSWLADVPEIVHVETPEDGWARMSEVQIEP